jgi:hypothetical protein
MSEYSIQTVRGAAATVSTDSRCASRNAMSPERFRRLRQFAIDAGLLLLALGMVFFVLSFPLVVGLLVRGILRS